jgi:N-acetylglucosaminyldiphosphoundecaprenol N-acetyl-beta-D-mannosaminyltransferase
MVPRFYVLGVGVSELTYARAVDAVDEALKTGRSGYVTVTGVHGVIECQDDQELMTIHQRSFLTTPDGMPLVWVGKVAGSKVVSRTYGPTLMLEVLKAGVPKGWKHFLYGGKEGVPELLQKRLEEAMPSLQIAGIWSPPFRPLTDHEEDQLIQQIKDLGVQCVWVGLSTPKQERFMARMTSRLPNVIMFGVGAAFDFHAGLVPQAPSWMQKVGLEWFYRLITEPKRLASRYFRIVPRFLVSITIQLARTALTCERKQLWRRS